MIPRSTKKAQEPESDSDWDSLPGDVSEQLSHSPVPPKQPGTTHPVGKHHIATKPVNMYKPNTSQRTATTFEDRSGGHWDGGDEIGGKGIHPSKDNLGSKHGSSSTSSKLSKELKVKQSHQQEKKQPPYTDFKEALSSPVPPPQSKQSNHDYSGVNQAYRIETEDDIHLDTNHENWDDSDNETNLQQSFQHYSQTEKDMIAMKSQQNVLNNNQEQKQKSKKNRQNKNITEFVEKNNQEHNLAVHYEQQHFDIGNTSLQFENCCLVKVDNGPFDERYRPSFYHGSINHFHVRQDEPKAIVTDFAEKSEIMFQRFWREVFGALQIIINFFTIFALELYKVVVHTLRYFISGVLYTTGDHLTKPLLAAIFNNVIQPFSILVLNIFSIIRNLLRPILELSKEICIQLSVPLRAFRLFEVNWDTRTRENRICTDLKVV